jgi:C1A family cysteine protease
MTDVWLTDSEPRQEPGTYRSTETALYSDRSAYSNMIDQCNSLMDLPEHNVKSTPATVLHPARSVTCDRDGVASCTSKTQASISASCDASYDVTKTSTAALAKPLDAKKAQEEEKKHVLATYGKATAKTGADPFAGSPRSHL